MKFIVRNKGPGRSRYGILSGLTPHNESRVLETPACVIYTRAGSVPHLTWDAFQHVENAANVPILVSMPTVVHIADVVREFSDRGGGGISRFVGFEEGTPMCVSVQDPAVETHSGYNDRNSVSVWNQKGRVKLTVDEYVRMQEAFQPSWYQALCDSDTPKDCSGKRLQHSVARSLAMLDRCMEKHLSSDRLKHTSVLGTVQGGYDEKAREKSAKETSLRPVAGFVIDGFHGNGPEAGKIDFDEVSPILSATVDFLPADKPRMMNGPFSPAAVMRAVECGIDVFDTSYAYVLTERGRALLLPDIDGNPEHSRPGDFRYELDLHDGKHSTEFGPLAAKCGCYTCRNFTRAYLSHLLTTSELLSSVLLMLHNLHVFLELFGLVRKSLSEGTFDRLKEVLLPPPDSS